MAYNPVFTRNAKGKYNPELAFVAIKGGTDAYLLEDELNEIQWIQSDARANLIRKITNSGCLQIASWDKPTIKGGLQDLGNTALNSFKLMGFDAVLDGYISYIDVTNSSGNTIMLPNPPVSGYRTDFVYLEFWFKEISQVTDIKKFGGLNNDPISYELIDPRLSLETSRRVQLQWAFRTVEDVDPATYPLGFLNVNGTENTSIYPMGPSNIAISNFNFIKSDQDDFLFIAGNGDDTSKSILKTIDGYVYGIPCFSVKRLNKGGYNTDFNPNGGVDYVNSSSISGRPDGKFANIVYPDQLTDIRELASLGKNQYDEIYLNFEDFENYRIANNTTMLNYNTRIKGIEDQLTNMGLDPAYTDSPIYGVDMFKAVLPTPGGVLQGDGSILSAGSTVTVPFNGYETYGVIATLDAIPEGKIGDIWVERADDKFVIKNTGWKSVLMQTMAMRIDSTRVFKGYSHFVGMAGIKIMRPMQNTDFVYIMADENFHGEIGEIYMHIDADGFNVYNTGSSGDQFTWIVIDTTKLNNIDFIQSMTLAGQSGVPKAGLYGSKFNVMVSTPIDPTVPGSVGDVSVQKASNAFTLFNTGANSANVQVLVFKEPQ